MESRGMKVDVVIPAYNAARYIGDTLRSVLAQTLPPARVIVVNDGSTDDTADLARQLAADHAGVVEVLVVDQPNAGQSVARNAGIGHGVSPFVAFLDADDLWHPKKLELQMALFRSDEDDGLGLVYCGTSAIDANSGPTLPTSAKRPMPAGMIFDTLLHGNFINGSASAAVVRRECLDTLGMFDPDLRAVEDWDLWLRISERYRVDRVEDELVAIRQHASMQQDGRLMLGNLVKFFMKWFPRVQGNPEVLKLWGHLIGEYILRSRDRKEAFDFVSSTLSPGMKAAFYSRTFGSFSAYIWLKRLRKAIP